MQKYFINEQFAQIKRNPFSLIKKSTTLLLYFPALLLLVLICLIRPVILIRIGELISSRMGHFAGNTELYLCEKKSNINTPDKKLYFDLFFLQKTVCNKQLLTMWSREITVASKYTSIFLSIVSNLIGVFSHFIPSLKSHIIKSTLSDRDIHGLLVKSPINLKFKQYEKENGALELQKMGVPANAKIVLLYIRDSAYLTNTDPNNDYSYHNYRDCDIDNFVLVAEKLSEMGYYVFRMGACVQSPLKLQHPRVIDYAYNGMRTDFMDIYLPSICQFVISTGNGGEVPAVWCYRKPWALVNFCPTLYLPTFISDSIALTKHHISIKDNRELTFREIISNNSGACLHSDCYKENGVMLIENTPEEICDVALEMVNKITGSWKQMSSDSTLQSKFWDIFPNTKSINGEIIHGEIRMKYGSNFLRDNRWWLK